MIRFETIRNAARLTTRVIRRWEFSNGNIHVDARGTCSQRGRLTSVYSGRKIHSQDRLPENPRITRRHQLPSAKIAARARAGSAVLCTQIYTEKESVCVCTRIIAQAHCIWMHAWKPLRVRTHMHVYIYIYILDTYTRVYTYDASIRLRKKYACTYVRRPPVACQGLCAFTCMYIYIHVCTYIYIHMYSRVMQTKYGDAIEKKRSHAHAG